MALPSVQRVNVQGGDAEAAARADRNADAAFPINLSSYGRGGKCESHGKAIGICAGAADKEAGEEDAGEEDAGEEDAGEEDAGVEE